MNARSDDDLLRTAREVTRSDPEVAEALLVSIGASLEPVAPPPRAKARLLARIAGERREPVRRSFSPWASAAAAALAAAVIVAVLLPDRGDEIGRLRGEIARLRASGAHAMPMTAALAEAGAAAHALWDRDAKRWFIVGSNFKRMPGRDLQFWFITPDGEKVPAGLLDVHDDGCGMLVVQVPSTIRDILMGAITDEPPGGSKQPTGQIQLSCTVPQRDPGAD